VPARTDLRPMTDLTTWIGKERVEEDLIDLFPARGMAALLDLDPEAMVQGSVLPLAWHWLYFKPVVRRSELGKDGHQKLGTFLPPIELPRRMWAGGDLAFPGELRLGDVARRRSIIESVEEKTGRSGRLVFITVRHRVETERGVAVDEAQNLVYREAGSAPASTTPAPDDPAWSDPFIADPVLLFRFSALTFNGHRIHYDKPYATEVESYPDLVVHGPLLALLLVGAAARHSGRAPARFAYRAVSPLFSGEPFRVEGVAPLPLSAPGETEAWVAGPRGTAMRATAGWEAR
jgi:3-methylfumaryl-CoA hydratase